MNGASNNCRTLWLGAHKTGTSFLQNALDASRRSLEDCDVNYVSQGRFRKEVLSPLVKGHGEINTDIKNKFLDNGCGHLIFEENLLGEPAQTLTVNGFYEQAEEIIKRVTEALHFNVDEVIIGIRPYRSWVPSMYCEYIRHHKFQPFDSWLGSSPTEVDDFARVSWVKLVRRLSRLFGGRRVCVYSTLQMRNREDVLLSRATGLSPNAFTLPSSQVRKGISSTAIEILNERSKSKVVKPKESRAVSGEFPTNDDNPAFAPFDDATGRVLDEKWNRDWQEILDDSRADVLSLE